MCSPYPCTSRTKRVASSAGQRRTCTRPIFIMASLSVSSVRPPRKGSANPQRHDLPCLSAGLLARGARTGRRSVAPLWLRRRHPFAPRGGTGLSRTITSMAVPVWSGFAWAQLEELRSRTSMKWRTHPSDVLPLWVAEMDVGLATAVAEAIADAIRRGDTGYPTGSAYAEAVRSFAQRRWRWDGLAVERTVL